MAASSEGGLNIHPMDQFIVKKLVEIDLGFVDVSITNSTLFSAIAVVVSVALFMFATRKSALVPGRGQSIAEGFYEFTRDMVRSTAGEDGLKYFPYIFTLFIFIFACNMLGMIPYSFTVTSHFAVTVFLALAVFVSVTAIGFARNGTKFLELFWIKAAPPLMRPILAVIELIAYLSRPISHSIRLGANMLAGHAVMKVFAAFVGALGVLGVLPIAAMIGVTALEFLVSAIQAYVFTILTCVYLNDALHPGHH